MLKEAIMWLVFLEGVFALYSIQVLLGECVRMRHTGVFLGR